MDNEKENYRTLAIKYVNNKMIIMGMQGEIMRPENYVNAVLNKEVGFEAIIAIKYKKIGKPLPFTRQIYEDIKNDYYRTLAINYTNNKMKIMEMQGEIMSPENYVNAMLNVEKEFEAIIAIKFKKMGKSDFYTSQMPEEEISSGKLRK